MLNFISMVIRLGSPILLSLLWLFSWAKPVFIDTPVIETPKHGEIIQGTVAITGNTDLAGFKSYDLYFAYAIDETDTWFLINQSNQSVSGGLLGTWDTTTITDGNYRLLLRVYIDDFTTSDTIVTGLKVRNYSQSETEIPVSPTVSAHTSETQDTEPLSTDSTTGQAPSDSAPKSSKGLLKSIGLGILISVLTLALIGGLILYRTLSRRK